MRRTIIPVCVALALLGQATPASAAWIWIPRLGQWINPKKAAKETPALQLEYAMKFWDGKKYDKALDEFKKLVKAYPQATQAPDAQYYVGRCQEEVQNYYDAFKAYRKVIQVYPASTRTEEILEREYRIGNLFFEGEKRKLLGAKVVSGLDSAIEVYAAIVDDAPFSAQGPLALYKLGMGYKIQGQYQLASDTFQRLVEEHPQHALVSDARFQIADCAAKTARASTYDQSYAAEAMKEFEEFVKEHPDSNLVPEAEEHLSTLEDQRARQDFEVARFYENRNAHESAKVYYQSVLRRYPKSSWAAQATTRLDALDAIKTKKP